MVSQEINSTVLEDTRNILLGHMAVGRLTSNQLTDNQVIQTASPLKSTIRFNSFKRPVKVKYHLGINKLKMTRELVSYSTRGLLV